MSRANKIIAAVMGSSLMVLGLVLLLVPGPGILFLFLGLLVFASEFIWARRLMCRVKSEVAGLAEKAGINLDGIECEIEQSGKSSNQ